jgi:hypothetical protein
MRIVTTIVIFFISLICLLGLSTVDVQAEIAVYDDDDQFLGFFVDEGKVYSPLHESFITFSLSTGDVMSKDIYFESDDCSGIPYIRTNPNKIIKHDESYYKTYNAQVTEKTLGSVITYQYLSCYTYQIIIKYLVLPAEEIDPPYNLPVALPLQIKFKPTRSGKEEKRERMGENRIRLDY